MCILGGTIGLDHNDTWTPYTNDLRAEHAKKVNVFISSLATNIKSSTCHEKMLAFMAENEMRQLGTPRIGVFAERVRPDPLHCEINAWQHLLDLIYCECVKRNMFQQFIKILSAPVGLEHSNHLETLDQITNPADLNYSMSEDRLTLSEIAIPERINLLEEQATVNLSAALKSKAATLDSSADKVYGCGLAYLASKIKEHYSVEAKRSNKLPTRLIGSQAVSLSRHGYRLVDALQYDEESPLENTKRLALSKAVEYLRNASRLFNKINLSSIGEVDQLTEFCQLYFNILVLFPPTSINVTVWTVGYAIPYHARKLYEEYHVGYGILSLQRRNQNMLALKVIFL